jgi:hypothetical protein
MRGALGVRSGRKQLAESSRQSAIARSPLGRSAEVEQSADPVPIGGHQPVRGLNRTAQTPKPPGQGQRDENGDDARDRKRRVAAEVPAAPSVTDVECRCQFPRARIAWRTRLESLERGERQPSPPVEDPQRANGQPTNGAVAVVDDGQRPPDPITSRRTRAVRHRSRSRSLPRGGVVYASSPSSSQKAPAKKAPTKRMKGQSPAIATR